MQTPLRLVSDPISLWKSNVNSTIPLKFTRLSFPLHSHIFQSRKTAIVFAANRRKRLGIQMSGKLMLDSAYIIASYLRILPEPVGSILREFGAGNGGRNGFRSGFGRGGSGGWGKRRSTRLGMTGILVILGAVGLWWIVGKELVLDSDTFLGGLGVVLLGVSVEGWRRGFKDWILGFFCCAFLVCLVSTDSNSKANFLTFFRRNFGRLNKGGRRRRAF